MYIISRKNLEDARPQAFASIKPNKEGEAEVSSPYDLLHRYEALVKKDPLFDGSMREDSQGRGIVAAMNAEASSSVFAASDRVTPGGMRNLEGLEEVSV